MLGKRGQLILSRGVESDVGKMEECLIHVGRGGREGGEKEGFGDAKT